MSDQFTFRLPCSRNSSSSFNLDRGGLAWKAGVLCAADGETLLTLSCQPTENKETLLWRCDANVIIDFIYAATWTRDPEQWPVLFNSYTKCSETKTALRYIATDDIRRIVLNVTIARCFIIDLSSPTNALISMPSDAARFEIAGRGVYLSKNILTRCSPFFDAMFNRDFLEKSTDSYALREVDFLEVMHLMAIIHRKTAFVDASSVGHLATLADMYDVREVAELCRDFLRFHKDEEVDNREIILERCHNFRQERIVIETKWVELELPNGSRVEGELEIGAFHCRLNFSRYSTENLVAIKLSPVKHDRSVVWHCVTRSSGPFDTAVVGNDVVEEQHVFSFHDTNRYNSMRSASTGNQTYHFCMELIESDFIDLSSPENEFIKDPEDAVCLEVDGMKLWFSKQVLTLSCASFCDLFKETKDVYIIKDVDFIEFLHFMTLLHSHKFEIADRDRPSLLNSPFLGLLGMAGRFRCDYMIDRCESFLCAVKDDSLGGPSRRFEIELSDVAVRYNLVGLTTKLNMKRQ